jgi:CheY-like chemotaxis protein
MKPKTILYLDDEWSKVEEYKSDLEERGWEVVFINNVDDAWRWLEGAHSSLVCIILDVMVPWGRRYDGATTDYGLLTGLAFYKDVRQLCGDLVPIFVLTNNTDPTISDVLCHDSRAQVILKTEFLSDEFGDLVTEVLSGESAGGETKE